jgi:transposase
MRPPLFVRPLTAEERQALEAGLRAKAAFTVRRCQVLLHSAAGLTPRQINEKLGWSDQCAREAIHAFHREGLACLQEQSHRRHTVPPLLDEAARAKLKDWLHQSPRDFDLPTSRWTLEGLAKVCAVQRLTPQVVSDETIRQAIKKLGVQWKRAKRWIDSPDPAYARKKGQEIG